MERFTVKLPDDLGIVPKQGYGWPEIAKKFLQKNYTANMFYSED